MKYYPADLAKTVVLNNIIQQILKNNIIMTVHIYFYVNSIPLDRIYLKCNFYTIKLIYIQINTLNYTLITLSYNI